MTDREYPPRPIVGIGVVVLKEDAVLLIQRGKPPNMGAWSLPGGAQELGETIETAEETMRFVETRLTGRQFLSVVFTGIRLLPGTELAAQAIAEGYIAADTDLSSGVFYHSPLVAEQALIDRVTLSFSRNPCIVHAADGAISDRQRMFYAWLDKLGVASPYWRFLPDMLSFPPLHYLRNKYPSGMAAGTP